VSFSSQNLLKNQAKFRATKQNNLATLLGVKATKTPKCFFKKKTIFFG
jgi:hypothetical protein